MSCNVDFFVDDRIYMNMIFLNIEIHYKLFIFINVKMRKHYLNLMLTIIYIGSLLKIIIF